MPFIEKSVMEQRIEFALLASQSDSNISDLCMRFNISRRTGYKWLYRYLELGVAGLVDKTRKPYHSPRQTIKEIEDYVVKLRTKDPEWGPKKLHRLICIDKEKGIYKFNTIPSKTTINKILRRRGLVTNERSEQSRKHQRFEHDYPNELWQMDFKGYFRLLNRRKCHPLTITDDHSRYNLCLFASQDQYEITVKKELIKVFKKYGLPYKILTDNAGPWGPGGSEPENGRAFTKLEKWLIQLNIKLIHGRPYHPQTQGKEERFHRTLKQELINYEVFNDHAHCQERFDYWRQKYNCIRPHEAIDFKVPAQLYQPSIREYPNVIVAYEYDKSDILRKVQDGGFIHLNRRMFRVGKAFIGEYVAIKQTDKNSNLDVYFCNQKIRTLTL